MDQPRRVPVWPFVVVCVILFVLTLRAPHPWERIAIRNAERILAKQPRRAYDDRALLKTLVPTTSAVVQVLENATPPQQVVEPLPRVTARIIPRRDERPEPVVIPESHPDLNAGPAPESPSPADALMPVAAAEERATWPEPVQLRTDLEQLQGAPGAACWAEATLAALTNLNEAPTLSSEESRTALARLTQLSAEGEGIAAKEQNSDVARHLRRALYALSRRLEIWQSVHTAAKIPQPRLPVVVARGQLANRAALVDAYFRGLPQGDAWRKYIYLEKIQKLADSRSPQVAEVAALAYGTLSQLEEPSLTTGQMTVLADSRVQALAGELKKYLADPADLPRLLARLEAFEENSSSANSRALARNAQRLRWSPMPQLHDVGEKLELHYRNANLRVAARGDLINLMLPVVQTMNERVNDEILGAQVQGTSQVSTRLSARLIPDDHKLAVALEAHGWVASDTEASHGPVTFYNQGQSQYVAEKVFRFDRHGLSSEAATARASVSNELTGMSTSYDGIPLLSNFVRMAARNQHDASRGQANHAAEQKVTSKVRSRLEEEMQKRLEGSEKRFQDKVLAPLVKLDLAPVPVEMQTTSDRLMARCRLATDEQLGAYTARPRAWSDSLMSVQIHESLFNNVIQRLKLDGRRVPLDELYQELATATGRPVAIPDDLPAGVIVQFAAEDALRVHLADGRLSVVVRLAELSQGKQSKWKNFEVRGYYLPDGHERTPTLVREGSIELIGEKLGLRDQIALRGIFSKVLDKKKPIPLVDPRLLADERLANVTVTQLVLEHGWLGIALGPNRAETQRVANEKPAAKR